MRFVLLSEYGDSNFLARRLLREGHDVSVHIFDANSRVVGEGLVPKQPTPQVPKGTDCVLFDGTGRGEMGRRLRAQGFGVIGGNPLDHDLEENRTTGTGFMRQAGIKTPETHSFGSIAQGQAFLATHEGHWYFKPNGDAGTDLTRNGESKAVRRFLVWAGGHVPGLSSFELQRAVDGAEVSVEGWFDGRRWIGPFNSTLETKKFGAGDVGARTGCQANVVWTYADETPRLVARTLSKITPLLRAGNYQGPLDLNCIIDADGEPRGLEWSARFGFDALQAYSLLVQGNMGVQLAQFSKGRLSRWDVRQDMLGLTLRLSTLPYPIEDSRVARLSAGLPLDPKLFQSPETTFLDDVAMGSDKQPIMAGRDGSIGCIGGTGREWTALKSAVLRRAKAIDIPSKAYRVDVVPDAETRWETLARFGYVQNQDVPGLGLVAAPTPAMPRSRTAPDGAVTDSDDDDTQPPFVEPTTAAP